MRLSLPAVASLCLAAAGAVAGRVAPAGAQPPRSVAAADSSATVAALARARRFVSAGNGASGRALVDSVLAAATPGTTAYAEALYWRASLAEHAVDAERDFRQLAVEYATTARGADALLRLAQLELVRGQPATAREHLVRLLRDHPDAPTQARGQYWLARTAIDANDPAASCEALNAAAAASTPGSDLARQVVALRGRVPRCTLRVAIGSTAKPAPNVAAAAPVAPNPALPNTVVVDRTPRTAPAAASTSPALPPRPSAPSSPRVVGAEGGGAPVAPAPRSPAAGKGFTVQVAAYPTMAGAEANAARLAKRGLEARAVAAGTAPDGGPFRVRIGRYATRAEATAALRDLKAKGLDGFVTDAEP